MEQETKKEGEKKLDFRRPISKLIPQQRMLIRENRENRNEMRTEISLDLIEQLYSSDWINIAKWDIASYLNVLLDFWIRMEFYDTANSIRPWDKLRVLWDNLYRLRPEESDIIIWKLTPELWKNEKSRLENKLLTPREIREHILLSEKITRWDKLTPEEKERERELFHKVLNGKKYWEIITEEIENGVGNIDLKVDYIPTNFIFPTTPEIVERYKKFNLFLWNITKIPNWTIFPDEIWASLWLVRVKSIGEGVKFPSRIGQNLILDDLTTLPEWFKFPEEIWWALYLKSLEEIPNWVIFPKGIWGNNEIKLYLHPALKKQLGKIPKEFHNKIYWYGK